MYFANETSHLLGEYMMICLMESEAETPDDGRKGIYNDVCVAGNCGSVSVVEWLGLLAIEGG